MNRKISAVLQAKAIKEINEIPNRIEEDVKQIRDWLSKEQHLKVQFDDDQILGFLRGCKYSLESTKEKIDFHFTSRTLAPEFFHIRDPFAPEIQEIINAGIILPLPKPDDKYGARIILWNFNNTNPDTMPYINLVTVFMMMLDIIVKEDDDATISGITIWADGTNCSAKYMFQMTPPLLMRNFQCVEKGYPLRIKGTYVTNCPVYLEILTNLIKSIMKSKIAQRMHVFSNIKDLYSVLPESLLPREFGGENGTLENIKMEWKSKIESYRQWFLEDANFKSEKCFRYGEPNTIESTFGLDGSFRKLDFD
ncbi:hypothetical protein FQA39_LY15914 [Lamprigera yunnana]|nr:hypothetical protein FQA39_LY15914 [Lamprigera yunnana]